jgi:hypothetical protein
MRKIPMDKILLYGITIAVIAGLTPLLHRIPRTRGRNPIFHALFFAGVFVVLKVVPDWVHDEIFSPGGVLVLGTVIPVYESVVAVCSVDTIDDTVWLQYWIASGTFSFATEFMDDIRARLPQAGDHW